MTKDVSTFLSQFEELFDNAKLAVQALKELRAEYSEEQWDSDIEDKEFIMALVDSLMDLEATVEDLEK